MHASLPEPMLASASALFRLKAQEPGGICVGWPGSSYELQLTCEDEVSSTANGRIRGVVFARGLRFHAASAGGLFVEPSDGEPRMLAGRVVAVDENNALVVLKAPMPIMVSMPAGQDWSILTEGSMVNGHVESGAGFLPVAEG